MQVVLKEKKSETVFKSIKVDRIVAGYNLCFEISFIGKHSTVAESTKEWIGKTVTPKIVKKKVRLVQISCKKPLSVSQIGTDLQNLKSQLKKSLIEKSDQKWKIGPTKTKYLNHIKKKKEKEVDERFV